MVLQIGSRAEWFSKLMVMVTLSPLMYLWVAAREPLESVSSTLILGVLIMWLLWWKSS